MPTAISTRAPWLRWAIAVVLAAIAAIAAVQLARVDAELGAPHGPDRTIRAVDATPDLASTDTNRARSALRARPVDGAAYRVLAQAQEATGHAEGAAALYQTAVARWPRDRIARAKLADRAFAAEDIDTGLQHLDALLRVAPDLRASVLATLMPYLEDPRVREGLAARLAADPPWRGAAVPALLDAATPMPAAEAFLAVMAARIAPTPAELQARWTLLERLGQPGKARDLWRGTLAPDDRAATALVFDGGFERPGVEGGYAWQLTAPAGTAIGYDTIGAHEGQSSLDIQFDGRAVQFAGVRQTLALPPRRYRLEMAVRNRTDTSRPFVWRVACTTGEQPLLAELAVPIRGGAEWQRINIDFAVPSACPAQQLQLHHAARSLAERRLSGQLMVDAVRVSRIH